MSVRLLPLLLLIGGPGQVVAQVPPDPGGADNPFFEPPNLLREMVGKGLLGRKAGRGFYEWEGDKKK